MEYHFTTPLWKWPGDSAWHFVTLPFDESDDIEMRTSHIRRGFGSVRVQVTVGRTTWTTSVFPDNKAEAYVLPVKRGVRDAERLVIGDPVSVTLRVIEPSAGA